MRGASLAAFGLPWVATLVEWANADRVGAVAWCRPSSARWRTARRHSKTPQRARGAPRRPGLARPPTTRPLQCWSARC